MSSPVRQMNHRRLPPLPGAPKYGGATQKTPRGGSRKHQQQQGGTTTTGCPSMSRDGQAPPTDTLVIKGQRLPSPNQISASNPLLNPARSSSVNVIRSHDLNPDVVIQYLNENPEFLESYVLSHVNQERLHRWTAWKEQVRRQRHGENINGEIIQDRKASLSKWKASMHSKKWNLLQELTRDIHNHTNKAQVLTELASCIATATSADGHNLYLTDAATLQLYYQKPINNNSNSASSSCIGRAQLSSSLASYVAYTSESVRVGDILADERFPEGLAIGGDKAQSVLGLPIVKGDGSVIGNISVGNPRDQMNMICSEIPCVCRFCGKIYKSHSGLHEHESKHRGTANTRAVKNHFTAKQATLDTGVVELYRNVGGGIFTLEDEEVAISMLMWADICVEYVEMYNCMTKQRKLNDFLLAVTKSIFQDIVSMDTVIMKIMNYAKKLVNADRASLFLLDTNTNELYARIFDTGPVDDNVPSKEIRFPMDKGVAGHVASTGEVLNIPDAYKDSRFNRDVDMQTGYKTKTILCMPIYIRGSIIGVVQMVNKLNGTFTKSDEESFETFAIYCGLALHHAKLYEKIRRSEQKYRVALEVLSYHSTSTDDEFHAVKSRPIPDRIPNITHYHFSPWAVHGMDKPLYVLYMLRDLYKGVLRFDTSDLIRFTLTVRKNYRNVPYHNWDHAFSVAHAAFTVVRTAKHDFTAYETLALFVACLCHDLDHRGKTNAFMVKSASPLAAIYSTSTMEHHHFNQTVTILQHEGHNIFKYLNSQDYKKMLSDIRSCILATDLALFFGNKAKLKEIADKHELCWQEDEQRDLVMSLVMTSCDLCAMYKPWKTQLEIVCIIMEEFWLQGDEEKAKGLTPMPMMDREKKHELPQLEVGFLVGICLPCYELMAQVLPETQPMKDGALANMKKWKELAEQSREAVEEELRIDINKRRDSLIQIGEDPDNDIEKFDPTKARESGIQEENESNGSGADDGNTDISRAGAADGATYADTDKSDEEIGTDTHDAMSTDEEVRELGKELHS